MTLAWILIGSVIGLVVGGTLGTLSAPKPGQKIIDALPDQLRKLRTESEKAASPKKPPSKHSDGQRGRSRRRRRGRRRRNR